MDLSFILPNKKEVLVKEILYKDLRKLSLYRDSGIMGVVKFLESFIISKNLNIIEKLFTFFILREKCIGEKIAVGSNKGNVNIDVSYIRENIGSFDDISEVFQIDDIKCTLNYPSRFNLGNTDFIFSLIESLEIGDEKITISNLSDNEYRDVVSKLPESIYSYLESFVDKHKSHFDILVLEKRERLNIEEIRINLLSTSFPSFIIRLFDCISDTTYREMIFILAKRIPDVSFLSNCTYLEIEDYYKLYSDEAEKQNESLQKENIS
jgi:hypothetical protein